jgi:hypothetical protein
MCIPLFSVCFQRVIFLADIEPDVDVQQVVDCVYVYGGHLSGVDATSQPWHTLCAARVYSPNSV